MEQRGRRAAGCLAGWVLAVLLAAVACGGARPPLPTAAATPAPDALTRVRSTGLLRAAVRSDAPPLGFRRPDGTLAGLDVDVARLLAAALLGDADRVRLVPVTATTWEVALQAGAADVALVTVPAEPPPDLHLSPAYYRSPLVLVSRRDGVFDDLRRLDGRTVVALAGSPAGELLRAAASKRGVAVFVQAEPAAGPALAAVQSGEAAALVAEAPLVAAWLRADPQLRLWQPGIGTVAHAVALAGDQRALAAAVDAALRDLVGGPSWRALLRRWRLPAT